MVNCKTNSLLWHCHAAAALLSPPQPPPSLLQPSSLPLPALPLMQHKYTQGTGLRKTQTPQRDEMIPNQGKFPERENFSISEATETTDWQT